MVQYLIRIGAPSEYSSSTVELEEWGGIPANGLAITYTAGGALGGDASAQIRRGEDAKPFGSASEWATHCGKKKWAQHNGITWDGITNSNIDCTSYKGSEPDNTLFDG